MNGVVRQVKNAGVREVNARVIEKWLELLSANGSRFEINI